MALSPQSPRDLLPPGSRAYHRTVELICDAIGNVTTTDQIRYYLALACASVQREPSLFNLADQVAREAIRLYMADQPGIAAHRQLALTKATRGRTGEGDYFILCPDCSAIFKHKNSALGGGPVADMILQRLLYKHWRDTHYGKEAQGSDDATGSCAYES